MPPGVPHDAMPHASLHFLVNKSTKMQKIFNAVQKIFSAVFTEEVSLTFNFNDQLLTGDMTAALLEMKASNKIDCFYDLTSIPNFFHQRFVQAAKNGEYRLLETLLAFVEIDAGDSKSDTALMHAARNNRVETCKVLLENGASVDLQSIEGYTALSGASLYGHLPTCFLLLEKGASINLKEKWNCTSFLHAFRHGHLQVCQLLLSKGATIDYLVDYEGKTCFDIAKEGPCRDLLRDHVSAKINESNGLSCHEAREAAAMAASAVATGSIFVVPVCVIYLEEPKVW